MPIVVDDAIVARIIVAGDPRRLVGLAADDGVVTTGLWWYRLARAVLGGTGRGRLSSFLTDVEPDARCELVARLPSGVEVLGLATLAPDAATWCEQAGASGIRLNALSAEAVAVTMRAGREMCVETPSPSLEAAGQALGFSYRVIAPAG